MTATNDTHPKQPLGEPDAHIASRRMETSVRVLLILSLAATVVLFIFYRPAAYLAAIPVPVLTVVLFFLSYLERLSRAAALRQRGQVAIGQGEIEIDVETIGVITILKMLGAIAVGTFIVAAAFFDLAFVGVVASMGFLLGILFQIFYLPLFFMESERDEREKLTGKRD